MFRLIIVIAAIFLGVLFYNKTKDYFSDKTQKIKFVGEVAKKTFEKK